MKCEKDGGLWVCIPYSSADRVVHFLEIGSGAFTKAIPLSLLTEGASRLSLLSTEPGMVNYIALVTGGSRISDIEWKVQIGPAVSFDEPIAVDKLVALIPRRVQRHVYLPNEAVSVISPGAWKSLIKGAIQLGNIPETEMSRLESLMKSRSAGVRETLSETISFERDAVAIALEVFGGGAFERKLSVMQVLTTKLRLSQN